MEAKTDANERGASDIENANRAHDETEETVSLQIKTFDFSHLLPFHLHFHFSFSISFTSQVFIKTKRSSGKLDNKSYYSISS